MNTVTLTPAEIESLTGYSAKRPGLQLQELHRLGFYRARRGRVTGHVIVERAHFDAVQSGQVSRVSISPQIIRPREARPPRTFPWGQRTALYRHFDAVGELLYIGIAVNPEKRSGEHRREQEWAARSARVEVEWFDTRRAAMAAERAAIQAERPKFNTLHQAREGAPA